MNDSTKPLKQQTLADAPQSHIYTAADGNIEVIAQDNEIWVSQKDMGILFGVTTQTVYRHIKSVIKDDKLDDSVISTKLITANDGKSYNVKHYSLAVVLPVGYRVDSPEASAFRTWANGIIEKYLLIGIVINQPLLESKAILKQQGKIDIAEKAGLGNAPEVVHSKAELEVKRSLNEFNDLLALLVHNPEYPKIHNAKLRALFGATSEQIKALTGAKEVAKGLPTLQLDILAFSHKQVVQILRMQTNVDNQRVLDSIAIVVTPLGVYLKSVCDNLGVNHITGKPLLPEGECK